MAARPTPSAPGSQWKPRWQAIKRDGRAEEQALEHADEQVEIADEMLRVLQVVSAQSMPSK